MTMASEDSQSAYLRRGAHFADALEDLNARIGTLARVLGADLATEAAVQHILDRTHPFFARHAALDAAVLGAHERRIAREWEELRGMLALRCDLMARMLAELGLDATRNVAEIVEAHREQEGLKPDADGFHLRHLLDATRQS